MRTWLCLNRESLIPCFSSPCPLWIRGALSCGLGRRSDFYFIIPWKQWDIWTGVLASQPLTGIACLLAVRIWWAGKDIHSVKALKSFSGWVQIPLAFNKSAFWQFWMGFWPRLVWPSSPWQYFEAPWMASAGEKRHRTPGGLNSSTKIEQFCSFDEKN